MPTPTVLPRMMLTAENVPSVPFEADKFDCGVKGRKLGALDTETSPALEDVSSSECDFEEYREFELFFVGETIEKVRDVARYVELA
jgi:hypothetical protein